MKINFFILLFSSLIATSCDTDELITGSYETGTKQFDLATFTKISHNVSFPVRLLQSENVKAELAGNANLLEYIELDVRDQTLFVEFKNGHSFTNLDMVLSIELPTLTELRLVSAGDAILISSFESPTLRILCESSGNVLGMEPLMCKQVYLETEKSGDIDLWMETTGLLSKSDGTAQIQLRGTAEKATFYLKGTSDFKGAELQCKDIVINHESTENAEVFASNILEGVIASTGDVLAKGNPETHVQVYGTGKLILLD